MTADTRRRLKRLLRRWLYCVMDAVAALYDCGRRLEEARTTQDPWLRDLLLRQTEARLTRLRLLLARKINRPADLLLGRGRLEGLWPGESGQLRLAV